jgi:hypothetical protein
MSAEGGDAALILLPAASTPKAHLALADSAHDPGVPDVEWGDLVTDAEYEAATTLGGAG